MADFTTTGWFPVVTLLIGFGTKSLSDWVQNKWIVAREREARKDARDDQRATARIAFQRETLLELQEATMQLGRATGRANHLDEMHFRTHNTWRKNYLPDDLDEGYRAAQARTGMLSVRVQDETVRNLAGAFRSASTASLLSADRDVAFRAIQNMSDTFDSLQKRIGELLREIDSLHE